MASDQRKPVLRSGTEAERDENFVLKLVDKLLNSQGFMEKMSQCIDKSISHLFDDKFKEYEEKLANLEVKLREPETLQNPLNSTHAVIAFGYLEFPKHRTKKLMK